MGGGPTYSLPTLVSALRCFAVVLHLPAPHVRQHPPSPNPSVSCLKERDPPPAAIVHPAAAAPSRPQVPPKPFCNGPDLLPRCLSNGQ